MKNLKSGNDKIYRLAINKIAPHRTQKSWNQGTDRKNLKYQAKPMGLPMEEFSRKVSKIKTSGHITISV